MRYLPLAGGIYLDVPSMKCPDDAPCSGEEPGVGVGGSDCACIALVLSRPGMSNIETIVSAATNAVVLTAFVGTSSGDDSGGRS